MIKPKIMQARLYQESVLGQAISKNLLAVLPTAMGKTNIAIMLAAFRLEKYPDSKIMMLAPTKPLVLQHFNTFQRFMNIKEDEMAAVTGMIKPDERSLIYKEKKMIFATPQTIEKDLENHRISLKDFSLLVIDEAHHSIGRYAYGAVAKNYLEESKETRLLALTASPGGTGEKIRQICENLGIEAVEIKTEEDMDVIPYIKKKEVDWVYVDLPDSFIAIKSLIDRVYTKMIDGLKKMDYISKSYASKKDLLALQSSLINSIRQGNKKAFTGMSYTVRAIKLEHAKGLLETQGVNVLEKYWSKLRAEDKNTAKRLVANRHIISAMLLTRELVEQGSSHPKMAKLCSIVEQQLSSKPDSRIIIFANYRASVQQIANSLERLNHAKPVVLVGQKEGLSQKEQMEVIERYNNGEYNTLITTSIGEEGLDIPSMDIALFYESVPSEIRSIQRRGRVGRQKVGKVVILIARGTRDEAYKWSAYHKERRMKATLLHMKQSNEEGKPISRQKTIGNF